MKINRDAECIGCGKAISSAVPNHQCGECVTAAYRRSVQRFSVTRPGRGVLLNDSILTDRSKG